MYAENNSCYLFVFYLIIPNQPIPFQICQSDTVEIQEIFHIFLLYRKTCNIRTLKICSLFHLYRYQHLIFSRESLHQANPGLTAQSHKTLSLYIKLLVTLKSGMRTFTDWVGLLGRPWKCWILGLIRRSLRTRASHSTRCIRSCHKYLQRLRRDNTITGMVKVIDLTINKCHTLTLHDSVFGW